MPGKLHPDLLGGAAPCCPAAGVLRCCRGARTTGQPAYAHGSWLALVWMMLKTQSMAGGHSNGSMECARLASKTQMPSARPCASPGSRLLCHGTPLVPMTTPGQTPAGSGERGGGQDIRQPGPGARHGRRAPGGRRGAPRLRSALRPGRVARRRCAAAGQWRRRCQRRDIRLSYWASDVLEARTDINVVNTSRDFKMTCLHRPLAPRRPYMAKQRGSKAKHSPHHCRFVPGIVPVRAAIEVGFEAPAAP